MTAEDFDEDFLQQLREAFTIEANEHLQSMTAGLLELEQAPAPARRMEVVGTIFRDAHSLKGAAGAISRSDIESVSRALEGIFAQWKTSAVTAP
ncbi:MAG TPA: Hpt domain-containing protein, partial [Luteolibacter sp.]